MLNICGDTGGQLFPKPERRVATIDHRMTPMELLSHRPDLYEVVNSLKQGRSFIAVEAMPAGKVAIAGNAITFCVKYIR